MQRPHSWKDPHVSRAARVLIPGRPAALAILCTAISSLMACTPEKEQIAAPDTTPPELVILAPSDRSPVADTVAVRIDVHDDVRVRRVTLLIDGGTLAERYAEPWVFAWATGLLPDSSFHVVQAEAVDEAGNSALSDPRTVCVRHNEPPRVTIVWPPENYGIDLDLPQAQWECVAQDPDEGSLGSDQVVWSLNGCALSETGLRIAMPPLVEGAHSITVRVRDRWGRSAVQSRPVLAFRYPDRDVPAEALDAFFCALRARNAEAAAATLADGLHVHAVLGAGHAPRWDAVYEAAALRALLQHPGLAALTVAGRLSPAEVFVLDEREWAKIEIRGLCVGARFDCRAAPDESPRDVLWYVGDSAARVFLTRGADDRWCIAAWWDLHGGTWCARTNHSWSALKAAACEDRLCP